jgi:DNA-binding Xre family transcriptional regulator
MFSYNKLWKLLIDRKMLKKDLSSLAHINSSTMAKMSKGLPVNMGILARICETLNCNIGDIVEYIPSDGRRAMDK